MQNNSWLFQQGEVFYGKERLLIIALFIVYYIEAIDYDRYHRRLYRMDILLYQ